MRKVEITKVQPESGLVHLNVSGIGYMQLFDASVIKNWPPYALEREKPWSITGAGVRFATKEECIDYLKNPPKSKRSQMSECEYSYSMSCCNGSVYAN